MKKIILILSTIIVTGSMFSSCQKSDNVAPDPSKVSIEISNPIVNQTFHNGDTVAINAQVNYVSELHGYEVKIIDTTSGFIVYDDAQHLHDDHFSIQDVWVCNATKTSVLKLELIADIDHDGTVAQKDILFTILP